ncbi:MAG TPA: hypothetical protein VJK29_01700 [Terriglobales bacterium]|nr:hypothetical protein [Terriglobales bacterium]
MRKNRAASLALVLLAVSACRAQIVAPPEIKDPELRSLQQQYMDDLRLVAQDILANHFDYPFYLSRKLDLDQAQQQRADQRSIRFDRYNGQTVLAITGNYYAAYSTDKVNGDQRARGTFLNVVMPILKAAVPRFQSNHHVQGYAVEISHHILGKVMGVAMERPENLMVFLPQSGAIRLLGAKDDATQQAALLQGQVFLNAEPITIWLNGEGPQLAAGSFPNDAPTDPQASPAQVEAEIVRGSNGGQLPGTTSTPLSFSKPKDVPALPPRDASPQALSALQTSNEALIGQLVKELDPQAHFVTYAAPKFVAFRHGIYLQLSVNTSLPESAGGSRYKLAAMAFDDHLAHLIRPLLAYFKDEQKFDGISFSTSVHLAGKSAAASTSQAVEFFFPFTALRCYEKYDCTGQQLVDAGTVLINGERVALDLQIAEGGSPR